MIAEIIVKRQVNQIRRELGYEPIVRLPGSKSRGSSGACPIANAFRDVDPDVRVAYEGDSGGGLIRVGGREFVTKPRNRLLVFRWLPMLFLIATFDLGLRPLSYLRDQQVKIRVPRHVAREKRREARAQRLREEREFQFDLHKAEIEAGAYRQELRTREAERRAEEARERRLEREADVRRLELERDIERERAIRATAGIEAATHA